VRLGCRFAVAEVTNRPVPAERLTVRPVLLPRPLLSCTERPGQRAAAALLMYLPVMADRFGICLSLDKRIN